MLRSLRHLARHHELFTILVQRNIKIRYRNSVLGFFWSLLSPVLLIVIYAVFLRLIRIPIDLPVLVTGIIVWQFLALCLGDALHAIVGNANLVTKAAFPRIILPGAMVAANAVNFLLSLLVLLVYLLLAGADPGYAALFPAVLATHLALCLGLALLLSAANVFFRDTQHILNVLMLAWFFLTPIIYEVPRVLGNPDFPRWVHFAFFANPMTGIVATYRVVLLSRIDFLSTGGGPLLVLLSFGVAWGLLAVGVLVFRKAEPRFGDEL